VRSLMTYPRKKRNFDDSEPDVQNTQSRAKRCKFSESTKRLMGRQKVHGKSMQSLSVGSHSENSDSGGHEEGCNHTWIEFQKSEVHIPLDYGVNLVFECDGKVPWVFKERSTSIGVETRIFPYVRYWY
jgi:hypothetical protein